MPSTRLARQERAPPPALGPHRGRRARCAPPALPKALRADREAARAPAREEGRPGRDRPGPRRGDLPHTEGQRALRSRGRRSTSGVSSESLAWPCRERVGRGRACGRPIGSGRALCYVVASTKRGDPCRRRLIKNACCASRMKAGDVDACYACQVPRPRCGLFSDRRVRCPDVACTCRAKHAAPHSDGRGIFVFSEPVEHDGGPRCARHTGRIPRLLR